MSVLSSGGTNLAFESSTPWTSMKTDIHQQMFADIPVRPRHLRADILHKNSSYYNQVLPINDGFENNYAAPKSVTEHNCEWKECRARFISSKDLLRHVQEEHLSCLPLYHSHEYYPHQQLVCQWRQCKDGRIYPARYKLLLHLQRHHCKDRNSNKVSLIVYKMHKG